MVVVMQLEASRSESGVGTQGTVRPNGKSIDVEPRRPGSRSVRRTVTSPRSSPVYSERSAARITFVSAEPDPDVGVVGRARRCRPTPACA